MRKTRDSRRPRALGPAIGLMALVAVGLSAGAASAEGYAYDLAAELMSPYCPGRTLASCPSPQAAELVQWISLQEAGGASQDEVVEMLVARFGEEILGAPPAKGITLWAWVLPIAGFCLGGGIVAYALHRVVRRSGSPPATAGDEATFASGGASEGAPAAAAAVASDEELERLVDAELAARR